MAKKRTASDATYLLRLKSEEHRELKEMADERGVSLAHAFREGARQYLSQEESADPLLDEFRAIAAKVERRLS